MITVYCIGQVTNIKNADGLSQLPAVHALKAESEDLYTYLLDQAKIHSSPDIHSIILHL